MTATEKISFYTCAGSWTSSEGTTYTDANEIDKPSPLLVRDASHAHAAGVINATDGLDLADVQSQEDGEAAYAKAVTDGGWHEGQQLQATLDEEAKARGDYGVAGDVTAGEEQA